MRLLHSLTHVLSLALEGWRPPPLIPLVLARRGTIYEDAAFDKDRYKGYKTTCHFRSADCGLHRVEKLRVAARCPARVLVVSHTRPGPDRSMYRQIAVVQHSQKKKNTELWYGRDRQGTPLRVQGEDKG